MSERPHFEPETGKEKEKGMVAEMHLATLDDMDFITEMARWSSTIEDRPLPSAEEVQEKLPQEDDIAVVATGKDGERLGAIWTMFHEPPLMLDSQGRPIPELFMSVAENARGKGVGGELIDEIERQATGRFEELSLNVHQRNPAKNLYLRKGYEAAGQGRGIYGIALRKKLEQGDDLNQTG